MKNSTLSVKFRNETYSKELDFYIPNNCPHCGNIMSPDLITTYTNNKASDSEGTIVVLLQCTFDNCFKYYCLEYGYVCSFGTTYYVDPEPIKYSYLPPAKNNLPTNIDEISPSFSSIYKQALTAEKIGLNQISGIGYRKALEFLIKDYAILKSPTEKEDIEQNFLGKVIAEKLSDFPKIQKLAKAANWIGTDATHYVQKYKDSDLESMKRFIQASTQFISADYEADNAQEFIDSSF